MEHPADIRHKAQSIDIAPVSEGWCHCGESEGMAVLWPADAKWLVETVERLLDASEGKMKRGEHLPHIHAGDWLGEGFKVTCACGDSWKRGDKFEDVTSTGKPILREVRGLKDARHAQRVHYETL